MFDADESLHSPDYVKICAKYSSPENRFCYDQPCCTMFFLVLKRMVGITLYKDLRAYICRKYFSVGVPTFLHYHFLMEMNMRYDPDATEFFNSFLNNSMARTDKLDVNMLCTFCYTMVHLQVDHIVIFTKEKRKQSISVYKKLNSLVPKDEATVMIRYISGTGVNVLYYVFTGKRQYLKRLRDLEMYAAMLSPNEILIFR